MREEDLIKSVEPIIDEITELNKKIENVKTIKGDKGDVGEKGEQGEKGQEGETGIGYNSKAWTKKIHRQDQIVQHFIGQQFKALKDTDKEPPHEDWERIGTNGFRWTGVKSDKTEYKDGDLFIDSGTTFLVVNGKAKMFAQRGRDGKDGAPAKDGKNAREFVHVKWHSEGISFVYDDGEIIEADVDGLNEIQKRMTYIEEMFESNEKIDAPIKRYAGAYKLKDSYEVGDTVQEAKSLYLCIKADANSVSLDPERWVKICNSQSAGKGSSGAFLPLAGGTMTGIIGSESKEFANLKLNTLQEINVRENNGGLDINLQPLHSSIFRVADGNKAGLTVDGKHLITASKEQDDELIKTTASDYYLTTRKYVYDLHMKNYNSIVDLEEEIDAIAPASARGSWEVDEPNSPNRPPIREGTFYLMDANDVNNIVISRDLTVANSIIISDVDSNGALHTWTYAKVGDHIEILRTGSPDYVVGKITNRQISADGYVTYVYSIESSLGNLDGADVVARIKIYSLETGLLLESLMPKSGGVFTGNVSTQNASIKIQGFYNNFSNNFEIKNNKLELHLAMDGTGKLSYHRPSTVVTTPETVATLSDAESHTITSAGNTMKYVTPRNLTNGQFASSGANLGSAKLFYFYQLYDYTGASVLVNNYEATPSTMLEIWRNGVLMIKTGLKEWGASSYSSTDIQARICGYGPVTIDGDSLSGSYSYGVVISGLRKKSSAVRSVLKEKLSTSKQNKEAKK